MHLFSPWLKTKKVYAVKLMLTNSTTDAHQLLNWCLSIGQLMLTKFKLMRINLKKEANSFAKAQVSFGQRSPVFSKSLLYFPKSDCF